LKEKILPLDSSWDVIVVGGGPSGCTAAAAAAKGGARTLLIEATSALGGMGTNGLVPAWCPFTDGEKIIYGGMAEKILKKCIAGMPHVPDNKFDWTPIDPELLKRIYDDLLIESGAKILFNTFITAVEMENEGKINAIIAANKSGLSAFKAKVYIDCTGDGDIAAWAGAAFEKGDEEGDLMPATHCFILTNVDTYAYNYMAGVKYHHKKNAIEQIIESGKYPIIPDKHACNNLIGPSAVGFNAGHIWNVDNTEPFSVSNALIEGRKIARAFRDALAEFCPEAFGNAFLSATGSLLGIRETRRILGDYYLTIDDFCNKRNFEDEICRNCYFIDIHHKKSQIGTKHEGSHHAIHLKKGESHGIPFRCLIPRKIENLLVAGRCISTDRSVQGSTRVMPVCLCTGEAAGTAASLALKSDGTVREINTIELREKLRKNGAYLP
ncbi:MAG TPA: FAD-dependent oxidoreductase, partial [Victivallales bacterium]|nr:FAD-dependent oxidoreductase [Victivallales bacterium]